MCDGWRCIYRQCMPTQKLHIKDLHNHIYKYHAYQKTKKSIYSTKPKKGARTDRPNERTNEKYAQTDMSSHSNEYSVQKECDKLSLFFFLSHSLSLPEPYTKIIFSDGKISV